MNRLIEILEKESINYELGVINNGCFYKLEEPFKTNVTVKIKTTKKNKDKIGNVLIKNGIEIYQEIKSDYSSLYRTNISSVSVLFSYIVKSHKQIPKCLLTRFTYGSDLYCINTTNNVLFKSSASTYNRELGYYSMVFEKYVSINYETKLGKMIKKIESFAYGKSESLTFDKIYDTVERIFRMTLFRNLRFVKDVNEKSKLSVLIDGGYNHEFIAYLMEDMKHCFLSNMKIFIMVNKSTKGLITLTSMISNIVISRYRGCILPLDPEFAIIIVPYEYYKLRTKEYGENSYIRIEDDYVIMEINRLIYSYAKYYDEDVIGNRADLEDLLKNVKL